MTPMQRYKSQIQELKNLTESTFNNFTLNKSQAKHHFDKFSGDIIYSKGVESDFLIIFKLKNDFSIFKSLENEMPSIALRFNYLDSSKEPTVQGSFKLLSNDSIHSGKEMSLTEFKEVINKFIKEIKSENKKGFYIYKSFVEHFVNLNLNLDKIKEITKNEIEIKTSELKLEINKEEDSSELKELNKKLQKKINNITPKILKNK